MNLDILLILTTEYDSINMASAGLARTSYSYQIRKLDAKKDLLMATYEED